MGEMVHWMGMKCFRCAWAVLALGPVLCAHAIILGIKEPLDGACVLGVSSGLADVLVEETDAGVDVATLFLTTQICFEVLEVASNVGHESCGVAGSGEAFLEYYGATPHKVAAYALSAAGERFAHSKVVDVRVANGEMVCDSGAATPFPLSEGTRRAIRSTQESRGNGVLTVEWPKAGDVVHSPTLVAALTVLLQNQSMTRITGRLCVAAVVLDGEGLRGTQLFNDTSI